MKTLILTFAIILTIIAISALSLFAQDARPGQPIKGVIVKGGQNPTSFASAMPGQPIGGIVVKGGFTAENTVENPLYSDSGHIAENPMAFSSNTNPYYVNNELAGDVPQAMVAGQPIGGIVVKGGKPTRIEVNPLYTGSGTQGSNPLYKGN